MMNSAKQLQKLHEKCVCDRLLRILNLDATFKRYGNDVNEPDCIYNLRDGLLGIEVATAYPENGYAKKKWTLARGERKFSEQGYEWLSDNPIYPDELMRERIQHEINDKCDKNYAGVDKIWLCIEEENPFSDEASTENLLKSIKVPDKHCFQNIYLLFLAPPMEGGDYKPFKIYP